MIVARDTQVVSGSRTVFQTPSLDVAIPAMSRSWSVFGFFVIHRVSTRHDAAGRHLFVKFL
jgi:hypothetical protein